MHEYASFVNIISNPQYSAYYFILISTVDVIIYVDQASGTSKETIVPKGK